MAKVAKIDYDRENDSLFLYTGSKAHDSLEVGNYIVDFDSENRISAVEILEASQMLKFSDLKKGDLGSLIGASLSVSQGRNSLYLLVVLKIARKDAVEAKKLVLTIPKTIEGNIKAG